MDEAKTLPGIVLLTQGHLEAYQEAFRGELRAAQEAHQAIVVHTSKTLDFTFRLQPPATFAYPFYQKFLELVQEKGTLGFSKPEQYGMMIRAGLLSGWIMDAPWALDDVPTLPARLATWVGAKLDETYSDYDYAVEEAQVKAAEKAGWFTAPVSVETEPSDLEALAKRVQAAYRAATELDPE